MNDHINVVCKISFDDIALNNSPYYTKANTMYPKLYCSINQPSGKGRLYITPRLIKLC